MKNKPSIVVFEVSDNNASNHDYGRHACDKHLNDFSDFIKSLGYDVELDSFLGKLKIEGHEFNINNDNASYMSKNSFTKMAVVRKPENRYIIIQKGYKQNLLKVQFNKEYDANKLRNKIDEEIARRNDLISKKAKEDAENIKNVTAIAEKYIDSGIKDLANILNISDSLIKIYTNHSILEFDFSSRLLKSALLQPSRFHNELGSDNIYSYLESISEEIKQISKIIKDNSFSPELVEWSRTKTSGSYKFKTMEYKN